MPVYRRKLKKGVRFYHQGQYLGTRYCSRAIYLTQTEAKRAEREKLKELDEEERNPTNDMPLLDLFTKRLDYIKAKKSAKYYKDTKLYFKKALAEWGEIYASKVKKEMVNDLLLKEAERMKKEKKTNHKVNAMLRSLKAAFNYAINIYDLNIKNPCVGLQMYPVEINLKHIPSDEDIFKVRELCTKSQKLIIDFVDQTGCRIDEAIRLKSEDITPDLITLWTRKAKNSNFTPRRIPRPDCLNGYKGKGRVFKEWSVLPRFLYEKVEEAEVKHFSWHCLRHRRASIWANSGMATFEIMVRLGHTNLSTTMGYLQLLGFTRQ